ncbi:MAG TPA: cytochrome-c peroxidase, partial [Kofleriaceae bacterium]
MKTRTFSLLLFAAALGCGNKKSEPAGGSGSADPGSGSAPAPAQRVSQMPQQPLPAVELAEDPKRAEKVALGNALFFDKRLSGADDLSCYSCHQNEDGNGGHDPLAMGSGKKQMTRHSPVIWNVGLWKGAFYWDGRAKTLEDNVKGAWGGGNMGAGADTPEKTAEKLDAHAAKISALPEYKKQFEAAFGKGPYKSTHVVS